MSNAESILDQMRSMPRTEIDDVRKGINALLALGGLGSGEDDGLTSKHGPRVFAIIVDEMQRLGLVDKRSVSYHRLPNRGDFARKADHLVEFLAQQHPKRLVQDGILRHGVVLLIRWLQAFAAKQGSFVVTPAVVARNIHKIPARLDREFPGYAACGMLHLLIPKA